MNIIGKMAALALIICLFSGCSSDCHLVDCVEQISEVEITLLLDGANVLDDESSYDIDDIDIKSEGDTSLQTIAVQKGNKVSTFLYPNQGYILSITGLPPVSIEITNQIKEEGECCSTYKADKVFVNGSLICESFCDKFVIEM